MKTLIGYFGPRPTLGETLVAKRTLADEFPAKQTLADVFGKGVPQQTQVLQKMHPGSIEEMLSRVSPHVIMGSGCENPPKVDASGAAVQPAPSMPGAPSNAPHYCNVVATFPTHAVVQCYDEQKYWQVPYEIRGDDVATGEPQEVSQVFAPTQGDDADSQGATEEGAANAAA